MKWTLAVLYGVLVGGLWGTWFTGPAFQSPTRQIPAMCYVASPYSKTLNSIRFCAPEVGQQTY